MANYAFVLEANLIFVDVKYASSLLYWADASESSLALDCRNWVCILPSLNSFDFNFRKFVKCYEGNCALSRFDASELWSAFRLSTRAEMGELPWLWPNGFDVKLYLTALSAPGYCFDSFAKRTAPSVSNRLLVCTFISEDRLAGYYIFCCREWLASIEASSWDGYILNSDLYWLIFLKDYYGY